MVNTTAAIRANGPSNPSCALGSDPNQTTAHTAAAKCVANLHRGDKPVRSSIQPMAATAPPPPTRVTAKSRELQPDAPAASTPTSVTAAIPNPAPRGVGTTCELRSLGTSKMPARVVYL